MSKSNISKPPHKSELKLQKILSKIIESNENEEDFIGIINENTKSAEIKEEPSDNPSSSIENVLNFENSPKNLQKPHNSSSNVLENFSSERPKTPKKTSSNSKIKSNLENITNINSKELSGETFYHGRNKTAFNFDFNSGTFETELIVEPETPSKNKEINYTNVPNEQEVNTRKNVRINHQSTKSEELGQFLYNAFNDDDNFMDEPSRDTPENSNIINNNVNSGNSNPFNNDSISLKSYNESSSPNKKRRSSVEMEIPYNMNINSNLVNENDIDNDDDKVELDSSNINKTDTKIDLIYYLNKKMDKKDFPKTPDYSAKLKNEINEKKEFEYISVEYKNNISNIIKKQYKSIKTNLLISSKDKETYLISSDDNGKLIVFSIDKDKLLFDVPNCYENDKVMANRNSKIKSMDHSHSTLICGYSNGYVVLYKTTNLPLSLKKIREYKNITKESITDIKIHIKNQKSSIFYLSDMSGCIYKSKIKFGMIKDKFEHYLVCKNENNLTYYNIQIFNKYHNIIAIANQKEIQILKVYSHKNSAELNTGTTSNSSSSSLKNNENRLKYYILFNLKYEDYNIKSFSYLPSFLFGIESDNFYISLENVIYVYKFVYLTNNEENINIKTLANNDIKVQIISSVSFDDPIMTIGAFGANLIYVIDSHLQISFINYSYNLNFNNIVKIKNEINLFEPKNIYDEEKKINISTFNNSIISANHNNSRFDSDHGLVYFYGIEDIAVLKNISFKEEIEKLSKKYEKSKLNYYFILFQTIIDIYKDKHPIFKKERIFGFENMINNIFDCFIFYFFNHCYNEKNNDLTYLEIFFYFLFEIENINYLVNECFEKFESYHRLEIYYKILEVYILNNKLIQDKNYPIKFYLKLIDTYATNDKKQYLSKLLLHLDKEIIYKNKEILEALNNNNIITTLMFLYSYNNNSNTYSKFNSRVSSLRSTIRSDVEYYDYFKPVEYIIDKIFYYNEKSENYKNKNESNLTNDIFSCSKENIDIYNDNLFYNINYFKLLFIFYLYDIIDKFNIEVISENDNYCLGILTSNEVFAIYNNHIKDSLKSNLIDEYFYLIKRIIDYWKDKELNENIKDLVNTINNKINNLKFHYDEIKDKVLLNFYELVIKISSKNEECKFSKILLIKSILFLLNNNSNTRNSENSSNFYEIIDNLSGTDNLEGEEDRGSVIINEDRSSNTLNIQNIHNKDLENDIIDILKHMDCITNNDYNSLVSACGNTCYYKVKKYVLENKI